MPTSGSTEFPDSEWRFYGLVERKVSGDIRSMVTTSSGHQLVFHVEFELFQTDFLKLLLLGRIWLLDERPLTAPNSDDVALPTDESSLSGDPFASMSMRRYLLFIQTLPT